jgi:glycosyltransferase involved in cell wall biosynthesis
MEKLPFVSVVMAVRNEAAFIERSLGAVLAQDYPSDRMEIIIADGISDDDTRDRVRDVSATHPNLRLIDNPQKIVASGLNLALREARGEFIIRVDGHTVIAPDYVRNCVDALNSTGADNVGGRMTPVSNSLFGSAVAAATCSRFGVGGARFHYSQKRESVDTVYLGAWRRDLFDRIGGFDEEMVRNQDDEFNYRLRANGGKILLDPTISSEYHNRAKPGALWRQYFQYGYWKVRVLQKHPRQMQLRQFMPPLGVIVLVSILLLAALIKGAWIAASAIVAVYLLANLLASLRAAKRSNVRVLPLLPFTFTVIHFAYGVGFLFGLIKFWNRWRSDENQTSPGLNPQASRILNR